MYFVLKNVVHLHDKILDNVSKEKIVLNKFKSKLNEKIIVSLRRDEFVVKH
jgi:hypothetical protein